MTTTGGRPNPVYPKEGIEIVRAKHLILDKSGIMKDDQGNPMFGEQIPSDIVVVGKQRSSESRNRRQVLDYDYEKKGVSLKASVLSDIKPYRPVRPARTAPARPAPDPGQSRRSGPPPPAWESP